MRGYCKKRTHSLVKLRERDRMRGYRRTHSLVKLGERERMRGYCMKNPRSREDSREAGDKEKNQK